MNMPYHSKIIPLSVFITCFLSAAVAETSKDHAVRGKRAWVAFKGASLASVAGDKKKQEKFFTLGFNEGKAFLEALKDEKIKKEDINSEVPIGMLLLLQGPSHDFILGRIFESASENALKDIYETAQSTEARKILAENALSRGNYDLILGK